jgi:hypothetical protein
MFSTKSARTRMFAGRCRHPQNIQDLVYGILTISAISQNAFIKAGCALTCDSAALLAFVEFPAVQYVHLVNGARLEIVATNQHFAP